MTGQRVIVNSLQRVHVCAKRDDGGYDSVALNIYPHAECAVLEEHPNGDVLVRFIDWDKNSFIFKKDELIYGN